MQQIINVICKLCGNPHVSALMGNFELEVPDEFPLSGEIQVYYCRNCKFAFNHSPSVSEDYSKYYSELNKHQVREGILGQLDQEYFSNLVHFIRGSGIEFKGKNVLDFGSGGKILEQKIKENGADICKSYDVGDPNSLQEDFYEIAISTHTFEHLLDPVEELKRIRKSLKKGGYLCLAVPDLENYRYRYYGSYAHFDLEHINHFTSESLRSFLEENDFSFVSMRQSSRQVNENISYSEILVMGKMQDKGVVKEPAFDFPSINSLISKYEKDKKSLISRFESITSKFSKTENVILYGLSSQSFRLLRWLEDTNLRNRITHYADSDPRMQQHKIGGQPILGLDEVVKIAKSSEFTCHVIVYSVNGSRILDMFKNLESNVNIDLHNLNLEIEVQ